MKILHTSDLHIGKKLYEYSLLTEQEHILKWMISLIDQEHIEAVIIAGDVYDRPVASAEAMALYNSFLAEIVVTRKIPVLAIAGNHDSGSRLEFGSEMYRASGYYIAGSPRLTVEKITLDNGNVEVFLLPYLHPSEVRALTDDSNIRTFDQAYQKIIEINQEHINPNAFSILVGHGFFSNLLCTDKLDAITSESEINIGGIDIVNANYFSDYNYVALGHLHAPQWVLDAKVRYCGSPLKYSLSEEKQKKSVTVLNIVEKKLTTEIIPIPALHDVRTIKGTLEELLEPQYYENDRFDDFVFAEIKGLEEPYAMEKLRVLFPNLLGLSFTNSLLRTMPEISMGIKREQRSLEDMFCEFYKKMKDEELPEKHLELVRKIVLEMEEEK